MPRLSFSVVTFAALSALAAPLSALPSAAFAAEQSGLREAVISVSGEGRASVAPDMAMVTLSVVRTEKTAREALDGVNKAMAAVLASMKEAGIAEKDLQTSGFFLQPQYVYPEENNGKAPALTGYQVGNTLSVRVRDLSKLGGLLDRSVTLGVNQGGEIRFLNDNPEAALKSARSAAVKDAMAKAKVLADAAGVSLGRIVEISENGGAAEPVPMARMAMAAKESADAVPLATGENSYAVNVSVTVAIAP